jgi:streptogramin lyase
MLAWCWAAGWVLVVAACGDDSTSTPDGGDGDVTLDEGGESETTPDVPEDGEAETDVVGCTDLDSDGHGRGCAAGPDCDDGDPTVFDTCASCAGAFPPAGCQCVPWVEAACYSGPPGTAGVGVCLAGVRPCVDNHLQYECPGQVLPDAEESCGDGVDNNCNGLGDEEAAGPCGTCDATCNTSGARVPRAADPGATGLDDDPGGSGVVLGVDDIAAAVVWVPNTDEGSVSKLDIRTGVELGRYRVGQTGTANDAPSRTAVDGIGDLYVANQANVSAVMAQGSVTKIAGDLDHCVDRNRSGAIDTSSGATRLPLGTDECVLWTAPIGASGAVPRAMVVRGAAGGGAGTPWVGTWTEQRFYRIDPTTGAVSSSVDLEVNPFGAVVAGDWIWVAGRAPDPAGVQRFNVVTSGLDPVVPAPAECDPYGIAADAAGRVWIGGTRGYVCRYDPADGSWHNVAVPRANATGVAVSPTDVVWVVSYDATAVSLSQFPSTDSSLIASTAVPGDTTWAVASDRFGYVWTVNYASNTVTRFDPATSAAEQFATGRGPVAYSDFTGLERTIVSTSGSWSADYERCDTADGDRWGEVRWTIDTPGDSTVGLFAATAATADGLAGATRVPLVTIPPGSVTPVDIEAALTAAGATSAAHLRLFVELTAGTAGESPAVHSVEVQWHCAG